MQSDNQATTSNGHDSELTPDLAQDILDLAARLSVTDKLGFSVAELYQIAQEADISTKHLDQAIAQYTQVEKLKRLNQVQHSASQIIRSSPSSKAVRSPRLPRISRKIRPSTQQKTILEEKLKSLKSSVPQHLGKGIGVVGVVAVVGAGVFVGGQFLHHQRVSQPSKPVVTKPVPSQPSDSSSSMQPCERLEFALAASLPSQQQMNNLLFFMLRGTLLGAFAMGLYALMMSNLPGRG